MSNQVYIPLAQLFKKKRDNANQINAEIKR